MPRRLLWAFVAAAAFKHAGSQQSSASSKINPDKSCVAAGQYFDATVLHCASCQTIDPKAELAATPSDSQSSALKTAFEAQGAKLCTCFAGLVQCPGGNTCYAAGQGLASANQTPAAAGPAAGLGSFTAQGPFQCKACPNGTAPSQDRSTCLPCFVSQGDPETTAGYSDKWGDCVCAPGHALRERGIDGAYLSAKRCIKCSSGILHSTSSEDVPTYGCMPCADHVRMYRIAETGQCVCKQGTRGTGFVAAGGSCVSSEEFSKVNDRFPEASAKRIVFRDLINGREDWWNEGPFSTRLGIERGGSDTSEVLSMDSSAASESITVESAAVAWLYTRCAVGCLRGNATACQCISNICVLSLYSSQSTSCRFIASELYEGRPKVTLGAVGVGVQGMPWIYYLNERPAQVLKDPSPGWTFTFSEDGGGVSSRTDFLVFWLGAYSLEGAWLGWQRVESQLDLCSSLGGATAQPNSPPWTWRKFGSSMQKECKLPMDRVLQCGEKPIFYDLFLEDVGGTLLPVPVRILNIVRDKTRPNLNFEEDQDIGDDFLVRRFTMCDAISGREGGPEGPSQAYLKGAGYSRAARWAAHVAVQVRNRADGDGKIFLPVLNLAYADKRTDNLQEDDMVPASFAAEYSGDASGYWTAATVFLVLVLIVILVLAAFRIWLLSRRYPSVAAPTSFADPNLFAPKIVLQLLSFCSTVFSALFWFHFMMSLYWLVFFKAQDVPHVLLPSAMDGRQYESHDVLLIIECCFGTFTVCFGLWKQLRAFFFVVDWEKPIEGAPGYTMRSPSFGASGYQQGPLGMAGQSGMMHLPQPGTPGSFAAAAAAAQSAASGSQMVGSPLLNSPGMQTAAGSDMPGEETQFPDSGVSAWRSLFICNELNERLTSTRTVPVVTWIAMAFLLEACGWKSAARWYTHAGEEAELAAQFNPYLEFSLAICVWFFVIISQLILFRVSSLWLGHDMNDFVDACSVANISVFILDEPFHGYYIHGKAPSSRGDWSHTELEKVLHDEDKGIGFSRGLTPDGCQTFEMFLPPDMAVMMDNNRVAHFRQSLLRIFSDVQQTQTLIASRRPERPTAADVAQMSRHRCSIQMLVDSMVNAVMRGAGDVLQTRSSLDWFWGAPPAGGVAAQQHPVFYKDQDCISFPNGLGWSSCLAYGTELQMLGVGFPTGFELHLGLLELLTFILTWRFNGSVVLGAGGAFILNWLALAFYAAVGKRQLAHTTVINPMFLI